MWVRFALLMPLWFLTVSASPLNVNETGRVMATLDDWRALMLVMLVVIVLLISALLWAFGKLAKAIEAMVSLREAVVSLNETARTAGMDARDNHNALQGLIATVARIEADLARIE